mgnify:CR=1 FL=1
MAGLGDHELRKEILRPGRFRFFEPRREVRDYADPVEPPVCFIFGRGTVHEHTAYFGVEFRHGFGYGDPHASAEATDQASREDSCWSASLPWCDSTFAHAFTWVWQAQFLGELKKLTKPLTFRTSPKGRVEAEESRLELLDGARGVLRARVVLRIGGVLPALTGGDGDVDAPLPCAKRGLHRVREALAHTVARHEAIDHDLDVVLELLLQLRDIRELHRLAVDARTSEALLLQIGLIRAVSTDEQEQKRRAEALIRRYQALSAEREARQAQRVDPNFARYKAEEKRIVEEVLALQSIPDGLSRDQYLRQRLQEARERNYRQRPDS